MFLKLLCLLAPVYLSSASITLSGNPGPLQVSTATAGHQPDSVKDDSTDYDLNFKDLEKKTNGNIHGALSAPLPKHTDLKVTFEAPEGASSSTVSLTTTPQVLVSNIKRKKFKNLQITYEFSANVEAGVIPLSPKILILTITAN